VHLLFRERKDILENYFDQRFTVARTVAKTIDEHLSKLEEGNRRAFLEYLSSSHYTASFEILDPDDQHIELLEMPSPEVRFIGLFLFFIFQKKKKKKN